MNSGKTFHRSPSPTICATIVQAQRLIIHFLLTILKLIYILYFLDFEFEQEKLQHAI